MSDGVNLKRILGVLNQFADTHNKKIAPAISSNTEDIRGMKDDIRALFELEEMNFYVLCKLLLDDVFGLQDRKVKMQLISEYQEEYLATVSVVNMFQNLRQSVEEDEEKTG